VKCKSSGLDLSLHAGDRASWGAGSHTPLLPRPRQVRYGPGTLSLRGLTIRFGSDPSPEDRVTAGELSSFLSAAAGTPIGL